MFAAKVAQVKPPSIDPSILYPVIAEPPLSAGAVQLKLICEEEATVAVRPVGVDGRTAKVVAEALLEGELRPTALMAETL